MNELVRANPEWIVGLDCNEAAHDVASPHAKSLCRKIGFFRVIHVVSRSQHGSHGIMTDLNNLGVILVHLDQGRKVIDPFFHVDVPEPAIIPAVFENHILQ